MQSSRQQDHPVQRCEENSISVFLDDFSPQAVGIGSGVLEAQRITGWFWKLLVLFGFVALFALPASSSGQVGPSSGAAAAEAEKKADQLSAEAIKLYSSGQYAAAIPLAQQALSLREQFFGPSHPDVATSLNVLGELYRGVGSYPQGESFTQRALALREQIFGPTHPDVAMSLNNLGGFHEIQGRYSQAKPFYQRALAIFEQTLGPTHPRVATSLNNLAALAWFQGNYAEAEPLYQRALAIFEQALGPTHPDVATSLNNLAALHRSKGDYVEATLFYQRALTILEQAFGPDHPRVAISLHGLGGLHHAVGRSAEAESLVRRAATILEQSLGPHHPRIASVTNTLATIYSAQNKYEQAEPLYQRALAVWEQTVGPSHPDFAQGLQGLASVYHAQGKYEQAISFRQRALAIHEQALGSIHPTVATALSDLVVSFLAQGDTTRAVTLMRRVHDIREHNLPGIFMMGAESGKLAAMALIAGETSAAVGLHATFAPDSSEALDLALLTVLHRKGRVIEVMADNLSILRRHAPPEEQALLEQWAVMQGELATFMLKGPGNQPAAYAKRLLELALQVQQLEAQLSAHSAAFRTQFQPVSLDQVQAAIPDDAVLIEIFSYLPLNPQARSQEERWGSRRYMAYILHRQGSPRWLDLGEVMPIDRTVDRLREELRNPERFHVKEVARELDALVMEPIRPLLGKAQHLLFAPDGALNLVPVSVFVDEAQRYLVERYTISYLSTGRDLVRLSNAPPATLQPPLVIGNPDFDAAEPLSQIEPAVITLSSAPRQLLSTYEERLSHIDSPETAAIAKKVLHTYFDQSSLHFDPLPGTAEEVAAVQRLLPQSQLLTAAAASKTALKQVRQPYLLHIATHGFFLAGQQPQLLPTRDLSLISAPAPGLLSGVQMPHPLLRSGLALAGANTRLSGSTEGIVTAMEIAALDLWGTALVVLSACETGVGHVLDGEGVYGLRRALVIAGAESQVMSLWKVSDTTTRDLMIAYYERLLAGIGRAEALRQAQLAMLQSPQQHPFYWAAFIPSGAWTPLPALVK